MRLSRHARNRARLYGLAVAEATRAVTPENRISDDPDGNFRYRTLVGDDPVIAVVAPNEPGFIITIYPERKRHDAR